MKDKKIMKIILIYGYILICLIIIIIRLSCFKLLDNLIEKFLFSFSLFLNTIGIYIIKKQ